MTNPANVRGHRTSRAYRELSHSPGGGVLNRRFVSSAAIKNVGCDRLSASPRPAQGRRAGGPAGRVMLASLPMTESPMWAMPQWTLLLTAAGCSDI